MGNISRIAVISAVIENPSISQQEFNSLVSTFKGIVKGRMGIPFDENNIAIISLTVVGELDDINSLTGKLGSLKNVTVKTAISKNEV